ncbi:unnamed protein product [Rotaria magnacalcarata]|uniref:Uncharacterized protein n=2 Tax=Rotaria magnacalcarata TaxID=392030 RepID=A0A819SXH3_9BILA|nr:unnamed protein product [Rotaria magnacalcarata]CAF4069535.1 unnamed protein product [Rotaria magnacalcarata]
MSEPPSSSTITTSTTNSSLNELMAVAEQCLSPDNRSLNIHSRNSSKTLKCPKCNWHYKYQETLEIHMKEKHQIGTNSDGNINNSNENETNCSYCLSNSVHPRLARGEQYPCGFKPYRCDLCLYSTTTKGNLAIHMQSDKHMNNCRDLSSPCLQQQQQQQISFTSSPENSSLDQTSQSQELKMANECSSIESYSCPLCPQANFNTMESLKEHLCSMHNCSRDALNRCLSLIGDSGFSSMAEANSSDEYRCHSCHNKNFKDFYHLLNHFQDESHIDEETKSVGLLCWKKGCNQYFNSLLNLEKHFREIHSINLNDKNSSQSSLSSTSSIKEIKDNKDNKDIKDIKENYFENKTNSSNGPPMNFLSKTRERLISIGEDIALHYLENLSNSNSNSNTNTKYSNEIICDLCLKKFSSLSRLKVHYEDIHSIVLSSRAIQHWIFLLEKLHSSSSCSTLNSNTTKLKRQSSSLNDLNQIKKSRSNSNSNLNETTNLSSSSSSSCFIYSNCSNSTLVNNPYDLTQNKRQRTRISDEQLKILRSYFNINNSPSDEQILLMSDKSQLTTKVIKHWFRNTLFKERQKNKDSPYNFSNPPLQTNKIDLDEYQKTGIIIKKNFNDSDYSDNDLTSNDEQDLLLSDEDFYDYNNKLSNNSIHSSSNQQLNSQQQQQQLNPQQSQLNQQQQQQQQQQLNQQQMKNHQQSSRRANRTRFSDEQLRLLQDAFESNPYPKDDDLEVLSEKLKLNSRVIVVWFQNARQKARKSYENNSPNENNQQILFKQDKDDGYSCKNCHKLFQRFAELMKHAKQCSSPCLTTKKNSNKDLIEDNSNSLLNRSSSSSYDMLIKNSLPLSSTVVTNSLNKKDNYCEQCDKYFNTITEFNEHQTFHMQAFLNAATLFPLAAYHPAAAAAAAAAAMAAFSSQLFQNNQNFPMIGLDLNNSNSINKKPSRSLSSFGSDSSNDIEENEGIEGNDIDAEEHDDDDDDINGEDSNDENKKNSSSQKRNRTTILPEQQDYLMSKYSIESNPSRKMLEDISEEVKLKKRVVQVWFQNTRARERKGNIKIDFNSNSNSNSNINSNDINNIIINKKCLHCSLTFKLKSTLENHLLLKHNDLYKKKEDLLLIDYDLFPNGFNSSDDLPLDLSKSSLKNDFNENKFENDNFLNESNDSSSQSIDDQNFLLKHNKHLLNGHLSPNNCQQSLNNSLNGQRRFRTQMTPLQIKLMKAIFLEYRTPTMPECELLGKEIQLQKRVVQVWFQNARAKEKKNPNFFKSDLPDEFQSTNDQCKLCQCKYTLQNPQRDHLFTTKHIENIRSILSKQIGNISTTSTSTTTNTTTTATNKDDFIKKNSINIKLDIENNSNQSVLDKSSKDEQNQLMSYINLMHLMPIGIDPYNYGLMDPNIHGTPLFMLQLPEEALKKILSLSKSDAHLTRAQYTQDGKNLQDLFDHSYSSIDYQTVDVGYVCKRCYLVWPLYESCRCHALVCWQICGSTLPVSIKSSEDLNDLSGYIFKIEQLTYRCLLCKTSCSTTIEYEKHTKDDIHLKKKNSNSTIQENDSY